MSAADQTLRPSHAASQDTNPTNHPNPPRPLPAPGKQPADLPEWRDSSEPGSGFDCDIAIVGAGPVGLALAGWLARRSATAALRVSLIDAREPRVPDHDPRTLAVSHGSRLLLEQLLTWPAEATQIHRIHISQRGHFGRTIIDREEHRLPALGYVMRYGSLLGALTEAVHGASTEWLTHAEAQSPSQDPAGVNLSIRHGGAPDSRLRCRLLINAEGGLFHSATSTASHTAVARAASDRSTQADSAHLEAQADSPAHRQTRRRDYLQTALIAQVEVSEPQLNVAWERFTSEGPLALLPCGQSHANAGQYALVWCGSPAQTEGRMAADDASLLAELNLAMGSRLGRFKRVTVRALFPLGLKALTEPVQGRIAAIGNAAQTLHPVAGQGLNLGLRDAHALAEAIGIDGATPAALKRFARHRSVDRRITIGATDLLATAFAGGSLPAAMLRGLALTALDWAPPIKTALARQMIFGQRR